MFASMVVRYMPNSAHGGPHMTPFMAIFVFYVSAQLPNIDKFQTYEVYKSREVSHLFSHQISFRMPPESYLSKMVTFIKMVITRVPRHDSGGIRQEI